MGHPGSVAHHSANHDAMSLQGRPRGGQRSAKHKGTPVSIRNLDSLFSPASVAIFGASHRPASVGGTVWRNIRRPDL
jgi:hypothetical protein